MRNTGAAMNTAVISFPTAPLVAIPAAVYAISQQIIAGYLTEFLQKGDGTLLGPPIGADQDALDERLGKFYARAARPEPGLALAVFRFSGQHPGKLVSALVKLVPRVRRMV